MIPEWNATLGYTAVEYDGGVLLVEKRGYKESDEELGAQITDTMAAITDSFEFNEFKPQTEYDYMPGKYTLNAESAGTGEAGDAGKESGSAGSGGEAGSTGSYPAEILLREDHTGTIRGQETTDITWYSRDNLIKENKPGGNTYYFSIEGDYLYLQQGEGYVEYVKDTTGGAAQEIKAQSGPGGSDKESGGPAGFATYESEEGWLVYYDKDVIDVSEKRGEVDFAFAGGGEDTDMLRFQYLRYDSTEEALRDAGGVYDLSTLAVSEGFLGGRRDAWGFTITMPDDSETERTFTAQLFANAVMGTEAQLIYLSEPFTLKITPEKLEDPYYYLFGLATGNAVASNAYKYVCVRYLNEFGQPVGPVEWNPLEEGKVIW